MRFTVSSVCCGVLLSVMFVTSAVAATSTAFRGNIQIRGTSVRVTVPADWGRLRVPAMKNGSIASGRYADQFLDRASLGEDMPARTKVFSTYPFAGSAPTQRAPGISVGKYPKVFVDDAYAPEPGSFTAEMKQTALEPLLDIYEHRGIDGLSLEQKRMLLIGPDYPADSSPYVGAWWGNYMTISDRIHPEYMENADGTLRGVGFFVVEGQDINFEPFYRAVLIHPETRLIVYLSLPLDRLPELESFLWDGTQESVRAAVAKGYAYLSDGKKYRDTPLGKVLSDIRALVSSLEIR